MPPVQTTIRLPAAVMQAVDQLADQEQRSRAQMLGILVHEALTARGIPVEPAPKRRRSPGPPG